MKDIHPVTASWSAIDGVVHANVPSLTGLIEASAHGERETFSAGVEGEYAVTDAQGLQA